MDNSYKDRYNFHARDIYDNIYDENEYEAVLIYRNEIEQRNKKTTQEKDKEILEEYKS